MIIRNFSSDDVLAIHTIYNDSKLDELKFEVEKFSLLPLHLDEKRSKALWESDIYVYEDGKVLGYGAVYRNEIRALFVSPKVRGMGIGKALLENLISHASKPIMLCVAASNIPAIKLYERFGFNVVDTFIADYNRISVVANRMIMIK